MGRRCSAPALLMALLAASLLTADRPVAHARLVKEPMPAGKHSSTTGELQVTTKPGVQNGEATVAAVKGSTGYGGPNSGGHGGSPGVADEVVVPLDDEPRPHPRKHN